MIGYDEPAPLESMADFSGVAITEILRPGIAVPRATGVVASCSKGDITVTRPN